MFLSSSQASPAVCRRFDASLLSRTRGWRGRVEARYATSVVCLPDDPAEDWLSLLRAERELGPCSLILQDLELRRGLAVRLDGRSLEFGDGRVVGLAGPGQALQVVQTGPVSKERLALQLRVPGWPRLKDEGFMERVLADALHGMLADARRGDFPGALRRIVGLGEGSTPSGDDMLVGLLAGFMRLAPQSAELRGLRKAVAALPDGASTPLGLQMLRQAAGGHFVEPLARLASRLGSDMSAGEMKEHIRRVRAVGARSGSDMLLGLYCLAQGECGWT